MLLLMLGWLLLLLWVTLLFGCAPPMMEEMAATSAAVKFGSAVMAAVAALTVSAMECCWLGCNVGLGPWGANCDEPTSCDN